MQAYYQTPGTTNTALHMDHTAPEDLSMTSPGYFFLVRMFVSTFNFMDKVVRQLGSRFYEATLSNVFQGLPPEIKDEAKHPDVEQPLRIFLECAQKEKTFEGLQRFYQVQTVREILIKRTEIKKATLSCPKIAQSPIKRPIFIVGFPRTGTSLLFNLLALDPQFRTPALWEMWKPTPPGLPANWQESKRYKSAASEIEMVKSCGCVGIDQVHELSPDNPEECIFMLVRGFLMYHHFLRLKGFRKFADWFYGLKREAIGRMYELHERQLQLLGYEGMDHRTWVLKAHIHLLNLEALLDVYPDACLVFTFRRLTEVLPSFCSLVLKATEMWGPPDSHYGRRTMHFLAELSNRAVRVMQKYKNMKTSRQPFFHLEYSKLVKAPVECIQDLYEHYGFRLTPEVEQRMRDYLAANPKHKNGIHKYSMEEYGLCEQDIYDKFGNYLNYFQDISQNLV